MVISALGEVSVGQWWPACPRKQRILVMGMIDSANFSNNKMHMVAFKIKTQVKLCHLTDNTVKSSFKRSGVYLSCRKLSFLHNKPLDVEARDRPAAMGHMMLSVMWSRFAEKVSLMCLLDSYSADQLPWPWWKAFYAPHFASSCMLKPLLSGVPSSLNERNGQKPSVLARWTWANSYFSVLSCRLLQV